MGCIVPDTDQTELQTTAAGALKTTAGEQALASFAFISNLAGVLLAIELIHSTKSLRDSPLRRAHCGEGGNRSRG